MQYIKSRNLFNKNSTLDGYEISNAAAGTISESKDWFVTDYIPVSSNTYYVVSGKPSGSVVLFYDNQKQLINGGYGSGYGIFFVSNASFVRLNGKLTDKDTFQLQRGQVATPYEPYMLPFKVLKRSRNLIPYPYNNASGAITFPYTTNGITFTESNGVITLNGTATDDIWFRIVPNYHKCLPNTDYSISGTPVSHLSNINLCLSLYAGESSDGSKFDTDGTGGTIHTTTNTTTFVVYIRVKKGTVASNVSIKPMLNKGEIIPYEPYIQKCDIQCPINIINIDKMLNKCLVKNNDGSYSITFVDSNARWSNDINVNSKSGSYIFSYDLVETNITSSSYKLLIVLRGNGVSRELVLNGSETNNTVVNFDIERVQLFIWNGNPVGSYTTFKNLKLIRIGD